MSFYEYICCELLSASLCNRFPGEAWHSFLSVHWAILQLQKTGQRLERFLDILALVESKGHMTEIWMQRWVSALHG